VTGGRRAGGEPWLFVVHTPYQLLMALLMSSAAPAGIGIDILASGTLVGGFGDYCAAVERRRRQEGVWPQVRITPLAGRPSCRRHTVAVASKVTRRFRAVDYARVFICHDGQAEVLALIELARRRGVPVSTLDEGLAFYTQVTRRLSGTKRLAVALTGLWPGGPLFEGDRERLHARYFDGAYGIAPDLIPMGFGPAHAVPLDAAALAAAGQVLVAPHQLDGLSPGRPPGIVVAPISHNTEFLPECAELIERLEGERLDGARIAVKYHPREAARDPLAVAGRPGFVLLDRSVPLEAYLLQRGAAFLVGPPSTALLFARRALPDLPVASLDSASELGQVLRRAGVEPLMTTGPTGLVASPRC
jgi:hypothetical protein